jgi:hypothetical protein
MRCTVPKSEQTVLGATGFLSYFYGYFVFLDVFGKTRRTGFCYAFDRDKTFSRAGGPAYNYGIEIFQYQNDDGPRRVPHSHALRYRVAAQATCFWNVY